MTLETCNPNKQPSYDMPTSSSEEDDDEEEEDGDEMNRQRNYDMPESSDSDSDEEEEDYDEGEEKLTETGKVKACETEKTQSDSEEKVMDEEINTHQQFFAVQDEITELPENVHQDIERESGLIRTSKNDEQDLSGAGGGDIR